MKKKIFYFIIILILIELFSKCFMYYYNMNLSYQLNKGYYNFKGGLQEYLKTSGNFIKKFQSVNRLIVEDRFNRVFYVPNTDMNLKWLKIKTNSFGMSGGDILLKKKENTQRIISLGSSYTNTGSKGNKFTDLLEEKLNAKYNNVRFEIINAGISSQNIMGAYVDFSLNWRFLNPDMIIIDQVFDDVPADTAFYLKNYNKLGKLNEFNKYINEYLKEHLGTYALIDLIKSKYSRLDLTYKPPSEEGLAYYETVLESLVLLGRGCGSKVVLLSCGIAVDRQHNFEAGNIKRKMLEAHFDGLQAGSIVDTISAYNKIMEKVAKRNNIIFIDMSKVVPKDNEHFVDASHRTDKGNKVFSAKLFDKLIENNAFNLQ